MTMKKTLRVLAVLTAVALWLAAGAAMAETADLSRMTDAEVIALYEQLNRELVSRGIERTATLPAGSYYGGEDLPVGRYVYTCLATGNDWGNVTIYSDRGNGRQLMWHVVAAPGEGESPATYYITINEGDRLRSDVPFSLTISPGVIFR